MGSPHPILLPWVEDPAEADLREVDAAIAMVEHGVARRVRLVALHDPEIIAPTALARAQGAGLALRLDRADGSLALVFSRRPVTADADR
jgi:hypothetical protein